MYITNNDLKLLDEVSFYLGKLEGEKAQELSAKMTNLIEKLEIKKCERNMVNARIINERRKTDRSYARPKGE